MPNSNSELLREFATYCAQHPDQRFWQALRNWAGMSLVYVAVNGGEQLVDTYYFKGKQS